MEEIKFGMTFGIAFIVFLLLAYIAFKVHILALAFPGNQICDLGADSYMLYYLSNRKAMNNNE